MPRHVSHGLNDRLIADFPRQELFLDHALTFTLSRVWVCEEFGFHAHPSRGQHHVDAEKHGHPPRTGLSCCHATSHQTTKWNNVALAYWEKVVVNNERPVNP